MNCETCKYFKLTHPPTFGECKRDSIARLYNDKCEFYVKNKNVPFTDFDNDSVVNFFKGLWK